jgi:Tfp pilus assembly protein PilX
LLIVLLAITVILTVVLSVTSRSVTDVTVTTYEEDALRAFSAAEAGVETALLNPAVGVIPTPATCNIFGSGRCFS